MSIEDQHRSEKPTSALEPTEVVPDDVEPTDAELIAATVGGSLQSFEVLVRRYNQRLFRVARAVTNHDSAARDAVQEGYIKVFQKLQQLDNPRNLGAWMAQIVRNEALMARRKTWRELTLDDSAHARALDEAQMATHNDTPEKLANQGELRAILTRSIDRLGDDFREVFVLRAVEGMSVDEVAQLLQVPAGTVKSRYSRARAELRADLKHQLHAPLMAVYSFDGRACDQLTRAVMQRVGRLQKNASS